MSWHGYFQAYNRVSQWSFTAVTRLKKQEVSNSTTLLIVASWNCEHSHFSLNIKTIKITHFAVHVVFKTGVFIDEDSITRTHRLNWKVSCKMMTVFAGMTLLSSPEAVSCSINYSVLFYFVSSNLFTVPVWTIVKFDPETPESIPLLHFGYRITLKTFELLWTWASLVSARVLTNGNVLNRVHPSEGAEFNDILKPHVHWLKCLSTALVVILRYVMVVRVHNAQPTHKVNIFRVVGFIILLWVSVMVVNVPTLLAHTTKTSWVLHVLRYWEPRHRASDLHVLCIRLRSTSASYWRPLRTHRPLPALEKTNKYRSAASWRTYFARLSRGVASGRRFRIAWLPHHVNAIVSFYYPLPVGSFYLVRRTRLYFNLFFSVERNIGNTRFFETLVVFQRS